MAFNRTKITVTNTPAVDTSAYADGDALTADALSFDIGGQNSGGNIAGVSIYKESGADVGMILHFFSQAPSQQTANGALSLTFNDAPDPAGPDDFDKFLGRVTIEAADWLGGIAWKDGFAIPVKAPDSDTIYMIVELDGAVTFAEADALRFKLHIWKD